MILFEWGRTASGPPGVALLYGSGLIGGEVAVELRKQVPSAEARHLKWTWPVPEDAEVDAVGAAVADALKDRPDAWFSVIWAAGTSGFGTTSDGMSEEMKALGFVTETARRLSAGIPSERRQFILVSSAGGLFEGQVACGRDAVPNPMRAYSRGKLAQESHVRDLDQLGRRLIVRPTSVYGYSSGARRGLVSALIATGLQRGEATLFGSLTTQRDYVFAPDVGRFIVSRVLREPDAADAEAVETVVLASARPASVFEIVKLVESYLGTTLRLKIDPNPTNASDNTFLPSAAPRDFRATSLTEGVAMTAIAMMEERAHGIRL